MRQFGKFCILATLILCGQLMPLMAQPSLNSADQMILAAKNEFKESEAFAVIRDGKNPEVFYVVPGRPRLEVRGKGANERPVFHLLKFQHQEKNGDVTQGGVLQFSVTFGIPEVVRRNLAPEIKSAFKVKKIRYAPFPIKSSQIKFYSLAGKPLETDDKSKTKINSGSDSSEGIGPGFGSQAIPFQARLTDLDSDLYDNLTKGNAGIPVIMNITYQGITPKLGAKVTVNWDQTYKSLAMDYKYDVGVGCKFVNANEGFDLGWAKDKLMKNDSLKIESTTGEGFSDADLAAVLDQIIPKIIAEMFETNKGSLGFPEEIPDTLAKSLSEKDNKPESSGGLGDIIGSIASGASALAALSTGIMDMSAECSQKFTLKSKERVKKGHQVFELNKRSIVTRNCSFGSCLNIKPWIKYKDELISVMQPGNWETAFFALPAVGDCDSLGIRSIDMLISPSYKGKRLPGTAAQVARYMQKDGEGSWKDRKGNEIINLCFPIMSLMQSKKYKIDDLSFKVETTITMKSGKPLKIEKEVPMVNGDTPLTTPEAYADVVKIDGNLLFFDTVNRKGLARVKGRIKASKPTFVANFVLSPDNPEFVTLIPSDSKSVVADIDFLRFTGKRNKYKNSGKDMKDYCADLDLFLFDSMWLNEGEKITDFTSDSFDNDDSSSDGYY